MNLIETLEKEEIARLSEGKTFPKMNPGDTVVSVVLQGSSAQWQPGAKLLVRHKPLTAKHGAVVHHGTFKIVNHSVEEVHDVVHPLAVSCHYFIAHSCLVL